MLGRGSLALCGRDSLPTRFCQQLWDFPRVRGAEGQALPPCAPGPTIPAGQPSPANPSGDYLPAAKRARDFNSISEEAAAAARSLATLGHGQLSEHRRSITYIVEIVPRVCIVAWICMQRSEPEIFPSILETLHYLYQDFLSILLIP